MQVVVISDTHALHRKIHKYNALPPGDVLIHCGDWSGYGTFFEAVDFNTWLGELPYKYKLVIAGNHDKYAWQQPKEETKQHFTNAIYLQDESVTIEGVKFYGMPWTPLFFDWYFMLPRGSDKMRRKVGEIPDDTDVLITHGPPMYKLDFTNIGHEHMGCEDLRNRIDVIKPRYHVFGHNHEEYGGSIGEHTTFINAATCNRMYEPVNKPICFGITARGGRQEV